MTEDRPSRVRVTGPPRRAGTLRPHSRLGDVHEQTALGGIYLRSLLREQLLLAGRVLALLAVTLGSMPLVFHFWPELTEQRVLGLPLAWVVLGGLGYPLLILLGWHYVRRVERNEAAFVELVRGEAEEDSS